MKRTFLLLFLVAFLGSCRKDFANLQATSPDEFIAKKTVLANEKRVLVPFSLQKQEVTETMPSNDVSVATASISDEYVPLETSPSVQKEAVAVKSNAPGPDVAKTDAKATKVRLRDVIKIKKELKANSTKPMQGSDTLALLGLIFGASGLLLLLLGVWLGILLGIGGFVCGLIALKKTSTKKTMAILGIVFGGITVLFTILALALLSSYGFI